MDGRMNRLMELTLAGGRERWGSLSSERIDCLAYELEVIEQCSCVDYMLTCAETARAIREAGGIVGPGRGSSCASSVCYALGITEMDPTGHGLLFERFMFPEQKHPTVICIDTDDVGAVAAERFLMKKCAATKAPRKNDNWPQWYDFGRNKIGVTSTSSVCMVAAALHRISASGGVLPRLDRLAVNDNATLDVFRRGATEDIPDFDRIETQQLLTSIPDLGFCDLAAAYAFTFPGMEDVRARYRESRTDRGSLCMGICAKYLNDTNGVLVYGEQLLLAIRDLAGFSRAKAARALKAVTHKMVFECDELGKEFVDGCLRNPRVRIGPLQDVEGATAIAKTLWNSFCKEGLFCVMKAHCVAYAMQAYWLAWLKVHYPLGSLCVGPACR